MGFEVALGRQTEPLAGSVVFVTPSTSGANAGIPRADKRGWFEELKRLVDEQRGREQHTVRRTADGKSERRVC